MGPLLTSLQSIKPNEQYLATGHTKLAQIYESLASVSVGHLRKLTEDIILESLIGKAMAEGCD
jgi:hypothetical protein